MDNVKEIFKMIKRNSLLLLYQINDLIDYSKQYQGDLKNNPSQFNFKQALVEVADLFYNLLQQKDLKLEIKINENIQDFFVFNDIEKFKQILINLIGNSIKFTFEGGIQVVIKQIIEDNVKILEFGIIDTGIGIKQEIMSTICEIFGSFTSLIQSEQHGIGLGLNLSKSLCNIIGKQNTILIESQPQQGTSVTFQMYFDIRNSNNYKSFSKDSIISSYILDDQQNIKINIPFGSIVSNKDSFMPLNSQPHIDQQEQYKVDKQIIIDQNQILLNINKANNIKQVLNNTVILIVDDTAYNIFALKTMLSNIENIKIECAYNGVQAIEKVEEKINLSEQIYDLIFMDINMPIMDGLEATRKIKKLIKNKLLNMQVPIITLTAFTNEADKTQCLEAGADAHLTKPVLIDQIYQALLQINFKQLF